MSNNLHCFAINATVKKFGMQFSRANTLNIKGLNEFLKPCERENDHERIAALDKYYIIGEIERNDYTCCLRKIWDIFV